MAMRHGDGRGFTLIEMAIVLVVLAVIAASVAPGFASFLDGRRLDGAARQLAADIQLARSEALARRRVVRLSIQSAPGTTCYVLHTGAAGRCACGPAAPVCASGATAIKAASFADAERLRLATNVGSLAFDPVHGTVTPTGTLRLADTHGRVVAHVVNVMGRVRTCAAGVPIAGLAGC